MNLPEDGFWDADAMGCGELVMQLRRRLRLLPSRGVLHLVAQDPGARVDLPAWCAMTGHGLVAADHPHYFLQRRD